MREIELTQDKIALVDDDDFERLDQYKWYAHRERQWWYAQRRVKNDDNKLKMHREIMNAPDGIEVDFINGNGLDCRKSNLRLCTHQQNMHNQIMPHKNNKVGVKGVCLKAGMKKFQAHIAFSGKQIYLGSYNVMGDADSAYRFAEEKYFGKFARNANGNGVE